MRDERLRLAPPTAMLLEGGVEHDADRSVLGVAGELFARWSGA
jgi:hypothetical protein